MTDGSFEEHANDGPSLEWSLLDGNRDDVTSGANRLRDDLDEGLVRAFSEVGDYYDSLIDDRRLQRVREMAMRRVEQRRRRRRMAQIAQWVCVATVVVAIVGVGSAAWHRDDHQQPTAAIEPTATLRVEVPSAAAVAETLQRLLSDYVTVSGSQPLTRQAASSATQPLDGDSSSSVTGLAAATAQIGAGTAKASVLAAVSEPNTVAVAPSCPEGSPGIVCTTFTTNDGIVVMREFDPAGESDAASMWLVVARDQTGATVQIAEWNGPEPKGAATVGMSAPPLSLDQLVTIATSSQW
jgi:hypothetical protein